jgi:NAD(P)-dependent dehydrogenase (short-subunit alcohol dehydrogenase family)
VASHLNIAQTAAEVFDLTGRRALVTGASRGIGRAIAVAFARSGAEVFMIARSERGLEETADLASGGAGRTHAHAADLSRPEAIEATVAAAVEAMGGIDVLVNNAGVDHYSPIEDTSLETWERVLDLNLQSCWLMLRAASPYLQDGGGKVINIASIMGLEAYPNTTAYVSAKHGLIGLTRAVALEWAKRGVQVNAIAPGWVQTAMNDPSQLEWLAARIRNTTPQGRWAQPSEIAWPAVFLASSASDYITGQVLVVDGGQTIQ